MTDYAQAGDMMVVSAAGSTTNQLISWLQLSQTGSDPFDSDAALVAPDAQKDDRSGLAAAS
jgi:aspartokinase